MYEASQHQSIWPAKYATKSCLILTFNVWFITKDMKQRYCLRNTPEDKPVMEMRDMHRILHHHWAVSSKAFTHERYRIQIALLILLIAYTTSRPGALVESSSYRNSNQALLYKHVCLVLIRNPDDNEEHILVLELESTLMKGRRNRTQG